MKIGIISDGQAEAEAFAHLVTRLRAPRIEALKPVYADMQPFAPPAQIVKASESRVHILAGRGAERHVVLLDRESRPGCPGDLAREVERAFALRGLKNVRVVIKNRAFENWLVADLRGLAARHRRRIRVNERVVQRIESSGADNVNALAVLDGCVEAGYNKRSDAIEICRCADPDVVERYSRSFRKFAKIFRGN